MRALSLRVYDLAGLSSGILGQGGALCFRAHGSSMVPFIRDGDLLTVQPSSAADLRVGDIALYRAEGDNLAVHRIVGRRIEDGRLALIARGDAAPGPGELVPPGRVLGRVASLQRGARTLDLDRRALRLAAQLWIAAAPLGPRLLGTVGGLTQLAAWFLRHLQRWRSYRLLARHLIGKGVCYRTATAEDAPALSALYGYGQMPNLDDPISTWLEHLASLEGSGCALVATLKDRIVGAAIVQQSPENSGSPHDWWIWGMLVGLRYCGAGIGQALLCRALEMAREGRAANVYLRVSEANRAAIELYRKMGFRPAAPTEDGPHRHAGSGGTLWVYHY